MSSSIRALDLGPPSDRSAVIVRARLPAGLARLRQRAVRNAAEGVPAHLTMLFPFVEPVRLRADVRRRLEAVARATSPFGYRLVGAGTWPDTIYAAVDPAEPFVALQRRLAAAFPDFPIYGTDPGFEFVPHVTIAEGPSVGDPATLGDAAWHSLPTPRRASSIELIARSPGAPWRTIWRVPLGRMRA